MALTSRQASAFGLTVLLAGGLATAFIPTALAGRDIRAFCDGLAAGATISDVQSRAEARGYRFERQGQGQDLGPGQGQGPTHALIEHPRSMGRATCDVDFDASGLLTAHRAGD